MMDTADEEVEGPGTFKINETFRETLEQCVATLDDPRVKEREWTIKNGFNSKVQHEILARPCRFSDGAMGIFIMSEESRLNASLFDVQQKPAARRAAERVRQRTMALEDAKREEAAAASAASEVRLGDLHHLVQDWRKGQTEWEAARALEAETSAALAAREEKKMAIKLGMAGATDFSRNARGAFPFVSEAPEAALVRLKECPAAIRRRRRQLESARCKPVVEEEEATMLKPAGSAAAAAKIHSLYSKLAMMGNF